MDLPGVVFPLFPLLAPGAGVCYNGPGSYSCPMTEKGCESMDKSNSAPQLDPQAIRSRGTKIYACGVAVILMGALYMAGYIYDWLPAWLNGGFFVTLAVAAVLVAAGIFLTKKGGEPMRRGRRLCYYLTLETTPGPSDLDEIALEAQTSEPRATREIRELMEAGFLPSCQLDPENHTLTTPVSHEYGEEHYPTRRDLYKATDVSVNPTDIRGKGKFLTLMGLICLGFTGLGIYAAVALDWMAGDRFWQTVLLLAIGVVAGLPLLIYSAVLRLRAQHYQEYADIMKNVDRIHVGRVGELMQVDPDKAWEELNKLIEGGLLRKVYIDVAAHEAVNRGRGTEDPNMYQRTVTCRRCGAENLAAPGERVVCRRCGADIPNGPEFW